MFDWPAAGSTSLVENAAECLHVNPSSTVAGFKARLHAAATPTVASLASLTHDVVAV
jgi:hypothetical protein